jgi:hypothetical protein
MAEQRGQQRHLPILSRCLPDRPDAIRIQIDQRHFSVPNMCGSAATSFAIRYLISNIGGGRQWPEMAKLEAELALFHAADMHEIMLSSVADKNGGFMLAAEIMALYRQAGLFAPVRN